MIIKKAEAFTFKHLEHKLTIPQVANDPRGPENMI
jgi:hypothetical protein